MKRVSTGIPGLDDLIQGGLPPLSVTLLTGGPGTGKTTFCSQFLWDGLRNGEQCLYITTEELPGEIMADASQYGMNFDNFQENFEIKYIPPSKDVIGEIEWMITEKDFDRIALDSLSVFGMYRGEGNHVRMYINDLVKKFREVESTVVMTSERADEDSGQLSRFGVAEFIADGVIVMNYLGLGSGSYRSLRVRKLRHTNHEKDVQPFGIGNNGLQMMDEPTI